MLQLSKIGQSYNYSTGYANDDTDSENSSEES